MQGWAIHKDDRWTAKTSKNTSAKMMGSILGASGLRIKCSLFIWSSSDVGDLFQVLGFIMYQGWGPRSHPWWWWPWMDIELSGVGD